MTRSSQRVPEKSVAERQEKGLNSSSNIRMGAQHDNYPQGYEELIPFEDGRICGTAPYFRRPRIFMMDPSCAGKAQ